MGVSASRNGKNASVPVVPGTWLVSAAVAEGMETGCVASSRASSDARSAGRVGAYRGGSGELFCGTDTVISNWRPRKRDKVANKLRSRTSGDDTCLGLTRPSPGEPPVLA